MNQDVNGDHRGPMAAGIAVYLIIGALIVGGAGILGGLLSGSCGIGFGHGCGAPNASQSASGVGIAIGALVVAAIFVISAWGLLQGKVWALTLALLPLALLLLPSVLLLLFNLNEGFGMTPLVNLFAIAWVVLNLFCIYRLWMNRSIRQPLVTS